MNLVTWNIQAGRGTDGQIDLDRIADVIRRLPFHDGRAADLICLQEVSRHFKGLTHGTPADQATELARRFPGYTPVFRAAVDLQPYESCDSSLPRRQFGCMVLSRHPVIQVFNHLLTQAGVTVKGMQRQLLEVVVAHPDGPLRVLTTHLEYNAPACRLAQVAQIRVLHEQALSYPGAAHAPASDTPYAAAPRPAAALICGDFNFTTDSDEYRHMLMPSGPDVPALQDAWAVHAGKQPHLPTCGLDDAAQWPQGPHCRDFCFATPDLAARIAQVDVDTRTRASDHQPLFLSLRGKTR